MLGAEEFTVVMSCTSSEIRNGNGRMDLTMTRIIPEKIQCLEQTTALVATVLQPFRSFILPLIKALAIRYESVHADTQFKSTGE
jgi:hypothetical protein